MGLKGLVQIQTRQALHIKAGEPHSAHKHHPQGIGRIFELLVQFPFLHLLSVCLDVQAPLLEGLNLVLLLADDHRHLGFFHPLQLAAQLLGLLLGGVLDLLFQSGDLLRPVLLRQIIHSDTGDLIQADEYGFAAGPQVGVMTYKILCNGLQALLGGQQMDLLGKLSLQFFLLIHIQIGPLDGVQNPVGDLRVVQIHNLITPVLIVQRNRSAILYRPLEVIHRYVSTEGALGDVVVGQQRRPGKANP